MKLPLNLIDSRHDKTSARALAGTLGLLAATAVGAACITSPLGMLVAMGLGALATSALDVRDWAARKFLTVPASADHNKLGDIIAGRLGLEKPAPVYLLKKSPRWFPKIVFGSEKGIGWSADLDAEMDWHERAAILGREYARIAGNHGDIAKIAGFARRTAWGTVCVTAAFCAFRPDLYTLGLFVESLALAGGAKVASNVLRRPCERMADYVALHLTGRAAPLLDALALTSPALETPRTALARACSPYPAPLARENEVFEIESDFAAAVANRRARAAQAAPAARAGAGPAPTCP